MGQYFQVKPLVKKDNSFVYAKWQRKFVSLFIKYLQTNFYKATEPLQNENIKNWNNFFNISLFVSREDSNNSNSHW